MKKFSLFTAILLAVVFMITSIPFVSAEDNNIELIMNNENAAIYKNTRDSLTDRLLDYGYARTSYDLDDGTYVNEGMFVRDSSVQALAHISLKEFDNARKILGYIAGVHSTYFGPVRASRCLNELKNVPDYSINYAGKNAGAEVLNKDASGLYPLITLKNECEAVQEIIIPDGSTLMTQPNDSFIYRTLTGVKIFLSSTMADGKVYFTLFKGRDENTRQLIGKTEMDSADISAEGEWVELVFGLPYDSLNEEGNYYLSVRAEAEIPEIQPVLEKSSIENQPESPQPDYGSIIWYGIMEEKPAAEAVLTYYKEKVYDEENPTPTLLSDGNQAKVKGTASYVGLVSNVNPLDDKEQTETSYLYVYVWLKFAEYAPYTPENDDFLKRSYPVVKKFADYFFTQEYLNYGGTYYNSELKLLLNANLEHTRVDAKEGAFTSRGGSGMWECYDLLTNVFASQALYMLSEYAATQDDDKTYSALCLERAENLRKGINENLTVEFDGKKIYAELIHAERYHSGKSDYLLEGLSYINYSPVGADWYGIDDDIMKNTVSKYQQYADVEFKCKPENPCYDSGVKYYLPAQAYYINNSYYTTGVVSGTTVGRYSGTHTSGRLMAWTLLACGRYGDYARMSSLFLYIGRHSYKGYYPETWQPEDAMSDMANQLMASWMVYTVSEIFYTADTVTVEFNSSGASGIPPISKKLSVNTKFIIPECVISKSGAVFEGWTDGTKTYKPGEEYSLQSNNVEFTAVFRSVFVPPENNDTKYGPYIALAVAVVAGGAAFIAVVIIRKKKADK